MFRLLTFLSSILLRVLAIDVLSFAKILYDLANFPRRQVSHMHERQIIFQFVRDDGDGRDDDDIRVFQLASIDELCELLQARDHQRVFQEVMRILEDDDAPAGIALIADQVQQRVRERPAVLSDGVLFIAQALRAPFQDVAAAGDRLEDDTHLVFLERFKVDDGESRIEVADELVLHRADAVFLFAHLDVPAPAAVQMNLVFLLLDIAPVHEAVGNLADLLDELLRQGQAVRAAVVLDAIERAVDMFQADALLLDSRLELRAFSHRVKRHIGILDADERPMPRTRQRNHIGDQRFSLTFPEQVNGRHTLR